MKDFRGIEFQRTFAEYTYIGCRGPIGRRGAWASFPPPGVTVEKCGDRCLEMGWVGIVLKRGTYCACVKWASYFRTGCIYSCQGNATQVCGGFSHVSYYTMRKYREKDFLSIEIMVI